MAEPHANETPDFVLYYDAVGLSPWLMLGVCILTVVAVGMILFLIARRVTRDRSC